MTITEFTIRLLSAAFAGMLIGFERQWNNKSAGIRTNTLVAIGAALYVLLSININTESEGTTRIIGQVLTGIGFLGAGIIFKEGLNVRGLTTAATVWCSAAIGCLSASGYYLEALIGTIIILLVNLVLKPIHNWLFNRNKP